MNPENAMATFPTPRPPEGYRLVIIRNISIRKSWLWFCPGRRKWEPSQSIGDTYHPESLETYAEPVPDLEILTEIVELAATLADRLKQYNRDSGTG